MRQQIDHQKKYYAFAYLVIVMPFVLIRPEKSIFLLAFYILLLVALGIRQNSFLETTPLDLPVFLFLLAVLFSLLFVANPVHSFPRGVNILTYILLFYALVSVMDSERAIALGIALFCLLGAILSVLGSFGMLVKDVKHLGFLTQARQSLPFLNYRLPGIEEGINSNAVGGLLLLFIPAYLVFVLFKAEMIMTGLTPAKRKIVKILMFMALCVSSAALALTQTRGAWGGAVVAFCLILAAKVRGKKKRLFMAAIPVILIIMLFVLSSLVSNEGQLALKQVGETFTFRIALWDLAARIISAHPFLGIGLNELRFHPEMDFSLSHAHNTFIQIAVELGLPALFVYMSLLVCLGIMVWLVWKKENPSLSALMILGLGAGQLAHLIFGLTDTVRVGSKAGFIFWISAALITALYRQSLIKRTDDFLAKKT